MLTQALIHVGILAYFLIPSGYGSKLDLHAGQKVVAKSESKTALVQQTFCEKCVVHSDVPSPLPKNSATSRLNLDRPIAKLDAAYEAMAQCRAWPSHEALPKRFDTLLSKVGPVVVNEKSRVGEVIAGKLNLYPDSASPEADIKETVQLRLSIRNIGADHSLNHRIAELTRGWLNTFQLPFAWDNGDLQSTNRNESSPPMKETISYPDIPLWLPGDDPPVAVYPFFIGFNH